MTKIIFDDLVKSLKLPIFVIPVETGIQSFQEVRRFWIPACAGMTTFYETIIFDDLVKSLKLPIFVIPAKAGIQLLTPPP